MSQGTATPAHDRWAASGDGTRPHDGDGPPPPPILTTSACRHYVIASHNPTGYAQVIEEHVNGNLDRAYTIGHTVLGQAGDFDAQDDPQEALTFLVDGHNSTMALVKDDGELDQRFAYDAYGNLLDGQGLTSASAANTNHLYTSEYFDADAQMQYLRARWYDPANGRFNRLDPFAGNPQDPQSLHKYLYAHANPLINVDPNGLTATAISLPSMAMPITIQVPVSAKQAVLGYAVLTAAQMLFRSWTIWEGVTLSPFHAYVVSVHRNGRTFRYDITAGARAKVRARKNPLTEYKATLEVNEMHRTDAFAGFRTPVGRLSEVTFAFWNRQVTGVPTPIDGWSREVPYVYFVQELRDL